MSYVNTNLMPGETVRARGTLHWWVFAWPLVGLVLLFVITNAVFWGITLFLVIVGAIQALVDMSSTELAVTNRRVIAKWGVLSLKTVEQELSKIESLSVERGVFGGIFDFGTIVLQGSGGTRTPIHKIARPLQFRKAALEAIEALRAPSIAAPPPQP
jgi:uncharacterized membrane protein YdbT with pleckstrin-like domain